MKQFTQPGRQGPKSLEDQVQDKEQSIIQDKADEEFFSRAQMNSQVLQDYAKRLEQEGYDGFDKVQQDAFAALYKFNPRLEQPERMKSKYLVNHAVITAAMQTTGYKQLRSLTQGDEIATIIGVEEFCKTLEKLFKKHKEELDKLNQQQQSAQDALAQLQKAKQGQGNKSGNQASKKGQKQGKGGKKPGQTQQTPQKISLKQAQELAKKAREKYKNYVKKKLQPPISSSFKRSIKQSREYSELIDQWGLNTETFHQKTTYKDKLALVDKIRNSQQLRKLSKIMGRIKPIALQMNREKTRKTRLNYQGITLGSELDKAIPAELASLGHPRLRMLVYKRYLERRIRQLDYGGKQTLGKGPIIIMCDESGSMSGDPELFAKAVGLTLLEVCQRNNRDLAYGHFSSEHKDEIKVDHFLKTDKALDPFALIELAEYFSGGGTNFENPLTRSREIIDDHKSFSKADILFITDGQCGVGDDFIKEFNEWKKEKKVSVMSVLVDAYSHSDSVLNLFSDKVVEFSNIADDNNKTKYATEIFNNLIT